MIKLQQKFLKDVFKIFDIHIMFFYIYNIIITADILLY